MAIPIVIILRKQFSIVMEKVILAVCFVFHFQMEDTVNQNEYFHYKRISHEEYSLPLNVANMPVHTIKTTILSAGTLKIVVRPKRFFLTY